MLDNPSLSLSGRSDDYLRLPFRVALLSRWVPPMIYGSGARVYRFFKHVAPTDYVLLRSHDPSEIGHVSGVSLPGPCHELPSEWRRIRERKCPLPKEMVRWVNAWLQVFQRVNHAMKALRDERCEAMLTFTGELADIPAACIVAQRLKIPFFPVVDDDYTTQWAETHKTRFARQVAPWVFKRAAGIFVISEYLGDVYRQRYGCSYHVLHTATMNRVPETNSIAVPERSISDGCRVVFTGSVYALSIHAVALTVKGLRLASDVNPSLHLYCWQTKAELDAAGINGQVHVHGSVPPEDAAEVQRSADILLVAFNLRGAFREVRQTSFPTKVVDYMVSGRPILAVAPPGSYLGDYLRRNDCAHVVDTDDANAVAQAVRKLATDNAYRQHLVRNAFKAAQLDFDYPVVVQGFSQYLLACGAGGRCSV